MKSAINSAFRGGYEGYYDMYAKDKEKYFNKFLLDPEFWKCLGKSEGWVEKGKGGWFDNHKRETVLSWDIAWHSLIDHLENGISVDDFFNKILK